MQLFDRIQDVKDIDQLKEHCLGCDICSLRKECQHVVFGEGRLDARLMFIGEGPGADEDRLGRPFVGRAGQLLDKIIEAIGSTREEVYIANIVKCRPPGNRVPKREEAEACLPWLYKQIEFIKPRVIVLLGATALQNLIDQSARITKFRGKWLKSKSGIMIMPTYHPAALLRDPSRKKDVWEDMKKVRDFLQKL